VVSSFVSGEIELWLLVDGWLSLASGAVVIVVSWLVVLDFVVLVFAVVLEGESVSLGVFSLGMDELQLVLV
jgi:hypothetical protein